MYNRVDGLPPTSNAPLRGGKATIYEGGSRVPAAVIWPGHIPPGTTSEALLTSTDWYPTILDMLSLPKPGNQLFDGVSQVSALKQEGQPRTSVTCFVPHYYPLTGHIPSTYTREGDWKLIRFHADGENGADRFELYNLKEDLGERHDLSVSMPDRVRAMNNHMTLYLNKIGAVLPQPNPGYSH